MGWKCSIKKEDIQEESNLRKDSGGTPLCSRGHYKNTSDHVHTRLSGTNSWPGCLNSYLVMNNDSHGDITCRLEIINMCI